MDRKPFASKIYRRYRSTMAITVNLNANNFSRMKAHTIMQTTEHRSSRLALFATFTTPFSSPSNKNS